jgi:hypothetical protein
MAVDSVVQGRSVVRPDILVIGIGLARHVRVVRARFSDGPYTRPVKVPNIRVGFFVFAEWIGAWRERPDSLVVVGVESTVAAASILSAGFLSTASG